MTFCTRIGKDAGAFGWRRNIASEAVIIYGDLNTLEKAYRFRSEACRAMNRVWHTADEKREIVHHLNEFLGRCHGRFNYVFYEGA